jgi:hypothetical protein
MLALFESVPFVKTALIKTVLDDVNVLALGKLFVTI